jgi:CheY-like chemotaxis protein
MNASHRQALRSAARRVAAPSNSFVLVCVPRAVANDNGNAGSTKPVRVLIVDDDWLTAFHLEGLLGRLGYAVVAIAADARSAIEAADRERPDLVLMDIRLRYSDGIQAAKEISTRFGIRPVYLTAHNDPATQQRAQASRPLGWLVKPATDDEVAAALQQAVLRLRNP